MNYLYLCKIQQVPHYINKLISQGENERLDFKFEISDSRKIARSLSAFSNTSGGKLLIGVKDNGRIAGVRSDEEFYMVQAAAQMYCRPQVIFESRQHMVDNKNVLEVIIPKHPDMPVMAQENDGRWLAYIRVKDENKLVNGIQIRVWKSLKNKDSVFIRYSKKEKILFDYLAGYGEVSFSKFCRIANLPRHEAENCLTDLVLIGILDIVYKDDQILFVFSKGYKHSEYDMDQVISPVNKKNG